MGTPFVLIRVNLWFGIAPFISRANILVWSHPDQNLEKQQKPMSLRGSNAGRRSMKLRKRRENEAGSSFRFLKPLRIWMMPFNQLFISEKPL